MDNSLKREIIKTDDGSYTIHFPELNEQYHSKHGALQEALHVFIEKGLVHFKNQFKDDEISILEIGFGTGLNALLTYLYAKENNLSIRYHGVEGYPVKKDEISHLNYTDLICKTSKDIDFFEEMHKIPWGKSVSLHPAFRLKKREQFFDQIEDENDFDLIYFDAFGARVQPDLWTEEIFLKMYKALKPKGVLVTYAAKGSVRRAMQSVGFQIERLPGPPGKREMLRATKVSAD